jgi:hypothetical protein
MKRHQLHVRITQHEYQFLTAAAQGTDESLAHVVRRLIRLAMRSRDERVPVKKSGTEAVPPPFLSS